MDERPPDPPYGRLTDAEFDNYSVYVGQYYWNQKRFMSVPTSCHHKHIPTNMNNKAVKQFMSSRFGNETDKESSKKAKTNS